MRRVSRLGLAWFLSSCLLLSAATSVSEPDASAWSDTIHSLEGSFAVHVDPETRSSRILRTDDRAGASPQLRVMVERHRGGDLEIRLHPVEKPGAPARFFGQNAGWDGELRGFRVEYSYDGKAWRRLVPGERNKHERKK